VNLDINSSYKVRIKQNSRAFYDTAKLYNLAVDFYVQIFLKEWGSFAECKSSKDAVRTAESLSLPTKKRPVVKYNFSAYLYKFPCYLRRAAIAAAFGKASSYKSNLANWQVNPVGKEPGLPHADHDFPFMYRENMFKQTSGYSAQIKVWIHNTWDWIDIKLRKSDVDYIKHHCAERKECVPVFRRRYKKWYLDFSFSEKVKLKEQDTIRNQRILAVDLGINHAATVSVMQSDGTILDRKSLDLSREYDCLWTAVNRLKGMQQRGNHKTPHQWAAIKGINKDISVKTAGWLVEQAILTDCDTIVFEHLDLGKKGSGSKKQRLALWKARTVQRIVTDKAHRSLIRISHINAWGTSRLAFDGSGRVERRNRATTDPMLKSYSICKLPSGKYYNCDLSASYNIGARYFVREILKSLTVTEGLALQAKVPGAAKRSQCTLSTLISLNAELYNLGIA
jgi:transposase